MLQEARRAAVILDVALVLGTLQDTKIPEGLETISLIEDDRSQGAADHRLHP